MQFIPSTFRAYAVDGDGDGAKNINNVYDAIFTAANYLATNKQEKDMTFALFRYNHGTSYVNKVKGMAASLR
jgi:membrane-bound lytic murein transglycosylase B